MTRRESREQAFALLFEKTFNDATVEELAQGASLARDVSADGLHAAGWRRGRSSTWTSWMPGSPPTPAAGAGSASPAWRCR